MADDPRPRVGLRRRARRAFHRLAERRQPEPRHRRINALRDFLPPFQPGLGLGTGNARHAAFGRRAPPSRPSARRARGSRRPSPESTCAGRWRVAPIPARTPAASPTAGRPAAPRARPRRPAERPVERRSSAGSLVSVRHRHAARLVACMNPYEILDGVRTSESPVSSVRGRRGPGGCPPRPPAPPAAVIAAPRAPHAGAWRCGSARRGADGCGGHRSRGSSGPVTGTMWSTTVPRTISPSEAHRLSRVGGVGGRVAPHKTATCLRVSSSRNQLRVPAPSGSVPARGG